MARLLLFKTDDLDFPFASGSGRRQDDGSVETMPVTGQSGGLARIIHGGSPVGTSGGFTVAVILNSECHVLADLG